MSNPRSKSLPVSLQPRTWCWILRLGKMWMVIGLLILVICNRSPFTALKVRLVVFQWESGRSDGLMRVVAALMSKYAMTRIGLVNGSGQIVLRAVGVG